MAISFVNKSAFASGNAALTVGAVANVQANDLILLFVESANQAVTQPTGYTQVTSSPVSTGTAAAAGGVRLSVYYSFATGADTTTSVADTGDHTCAIKIAYRGVNTTTPFDVTPVSGIKTPASTSTVFPSITTATNRALIVLSTALDLDANSTTTTGAATNANLTGLAERHDQTVATGVGGGLVIIDGTDAVAGSTGTTTATVTSTVQVFLTIALRESPVTGTLAATEDADTFSSSGTVLVKGALTVAESGVDTFSASGTVVSMAVTGSLAAAEAGNDTLSSSGTVLVSGFLVASEIGSDSFAATGDVIVSGSLSASETGSDSFSAVGTVVVAGSLASSEVGNDSFVSSGKVIVTGSLAVSEVGSDTFTAIGTAIVVSSGALSVTEANDTFSSSGKVLVSGSLANSESGTDAFTSAGLVRVSGSFAVTESTDTFTSVGKVVVQGALSSTEVGLDTFASTGTAPPTRLGAFAVLEGNDTLASTAKVIIQGNLVVTEVGADSFVATGFLPISVVVNLSGVAASSLCGSVSVVGTATALPSGLSATGEVGTANFYLSARYGEGIYGISRYGIAYRVVQPTGVLATGSINSVDIKANATITVAGTTSTSFIGSVIIRAASQVPVTGVFSTGFIGTVSIRENARPTFDGVGATGFVGTTTVTVTVFNYEAVRDLYAPQRTVYVDRRSTSRDRTVFVSSSNRTVLVEASQSSNRVVYINAQPRVVIVDRRSTSDDREVLAA